MKPLFYCLLLLILSINSCYAQSILGKWISIDDQTGEEKAVVEIYEKEGEYFGKIIEFLEKGAQPNDACEHCKGKMKGKKLMGFEVLKNFKKNGDVFENGTVTDPEADKTYPSKIWVDEKDNSILNVRGYVSVFYRTQQWKRYHQNP